MIAIITGDIINSRSEKTSAWLPVLKAILRQYGKSPKNWEIFRGDSFQLEVVPEKAMQAALHIKAGIKQNPNLDVRLAVGVGEKTHSADRITESNGSAFIYSGECFEGLKKQTIGIKTAKKEVDETFNLLLELATLTINQWSPVASLVIKSTLENPSMNQQELAVLLKKSQSSISEALKRGGFDEVMRMESKYKSLIKTL